MICKLENKSGLLFQYIFKLRLCISIVPGSAEEAAVVFGEAASLSIQKQYLHHGLASQSLLTLNEDCNLVSARNFSSEDVSQRQFKHMQGNNIRDVSGNSHVILGGASGHPMNGSSSLSFYNTPSPMPMQVYISYLLHFCSSSPAFIAASLSFLPLPNIPHGFE